MLIDSKDAHNKGRYKIKNFKPKRFPLLYLKKIFKYFVQFYFILY